MATFVEMFWACELNVVSLPSGNVMNFGCGIRVDGDRRLPFSLIGEESSFAFVRIKGLFWWPYLVAAVTARCCSLSVNSLL